MINRTSKYFIPEKSPWPIIGSLGMFFLVIGIIYLIRHNLIVGGTTFFIGALILASVMFGLFSNVISEGKDGLHSLQMERSFRWGMFWFIVSEVMFFAVFFGALFYARIYAVPWLGGEGVGDMTHQILWPNFIAQWPLFKNPNPQLFPGPHKVIPAWGIPAINTFLLLSSALTVTWAHWGIKRQRKFQLVIGLIITLILGGAFLGCQIYEYLLAHHHYGLTMSSGIYGTTFFMLTGFHGAHVTLGMIMLFVMLIRGIRGDFTADNHFGFEAAAWYWHFVDVVWLFLFVFVYWL